MADLDLANALGPFTIHNIPFGVITTPQHPRPNCAAAIGDYALCLRQYASAGKLSHLDDSVDFEHIFSQDSLNMFAGLPRSLRSRTRKTLQQDILNQSLPSECLVPLDKVTLALPFKIGGYADFYCSLEHCKNCSPMSANTIPKNWFYAPSVYNGRSSSIIPSPHPIRRPKGLFYDNMTDKNPEYGASRMLDYELELGYFVSKPVPYGETIDIRDVEEHLFGFVLLNDWSARDLQLFEMTPLGPFHGKGFGTSISPWVVTLDALEPFRCSSKTKQIPPPFPHLKWPDEETAAFDIKLRVAIQRGGKLYDMASSNLKYLYWTPFQQLTHHAAAGCGMKTGDLLGTGTISGDGLDETGKKRELGCLYEATEAGSKFTHLPNGEPFMYLEDGDEVILEGFCEVDTQNGVSLGFGQCRGKILPALS